MGWNNDLTNLLPFPNVCMQSVKTIVNYRTHIAKTEIKDGI